MKYFTLLSFIESVTSTEDVVHPPCLVYVWFTPPIYNISRYASTFVATFLIKVFSWVLNNSLIGFVGSLIGVILMYNANAPAGLILGLISKPPSPPVLPHWKNALPLGNVGVVAKVTPGFDDITAAMADAGT